MELKFLGIGAAYNPAWGSNCAYFLAGKHLYLLDCGETTFHSMVNRPELAQCEAVTILVTHMHADHIGSLGSFASYSTHVLKKSVTVAFPDAVLKTVLTLMGIGDRDFHFQSEFDSPFPGGLAVTPVKVQHEPAMTCVGYLISDGQETIYYGCDSNQVPKQILDQLLAGELSHVYQEATLKNGKSSGHCSLEYLCQVIPPRMRGLVTCMHFGSDFREDVRREGFCVAELEQQQIKIGPEE